MKNGVNIAGVSESAHEIRERPVEAHHVYRVGATWDARGSLQARTGSVTLGTSRVGRDFRVSCTPGPRAPGPAPSPELLTPAEMFLVGAGACLLTTAVLGASSKGHTLLSASLLMGRAEPGRPWAVDYDLFVRADATPEELIETVRTSCERSPSHRSLVEGGAVSWSLRQPPATAARPGDIVSAARDVAVASEPWPFASDRRRSAGGRHLGVRWDYGVQLSFWPDSESARHARFPVDQTKQFGGMDRGPNPQEYLLCGLAASVAETAASLARARDISVHEVTCLAQGRVDLHGLLGLNAAVPDKIQDVSCALSFRGGATPEQQAALAREAVEVAEVSRLLTLPQPARLSLARDGEHLHELVSGP
ncbi:MAG TPA: OsmC family protein [Polyangiaceae bacterium]|nr:OsmC family protein [Polyangiaceae bacterium]